MTISLEATWVMTSTLSEESAKTISRHSLHPGSALPTSGVTTNTALRESTTMTFGVMTTTLKHSVDSNTVQRTISTFGLVMVLMKLLLVTLMRPMEDSGISFMARTVMITSALVLVGLISTSLETRTTMS